MPVLKRRAHRPPPGTAPGTITPDPNAAPPRIEVLSYGPDADPATIRLQRIASIAELPDLPSGHTIRWINVSGLGDATVLHAIGAHFGLHALVLEDIANTVQRPKVEPYTDYLFIVTRVPVGDRARAPLLATEQLSICLGRDWVLTFQESAGYVFEPVRHRLMGANHGMQAHGADYLAYAILDAAIDAWFPLLEVYGEDLEDLESAVIGKPAVSQIGAIHGLKRNLLTARRAIWPQRELLNGLIRDETPLVSANTRLYLRDCYDHTIQLMDVIETYREIASGLVDIQLSSQSNRMNEIMKVLTIIATIFIPLSFVVGVYGMNFDTTSPWNLPELHWRYGYPAVWILMLMIAGSLLLWFRHKGWMGSTPERRTRNRP
jgi:magnesium transporter